MGGGRGDGGERRVLGQILGARGQVAGSAGRPRGRGGEDKVRLMDGGGAVDVARVGVSQPQGQLAR